MDAGLDSAIALVGRASQTGHLTVLIAKGSFQYTDALRALKWFRNFWEAFEGTGEPSTPLIRDSSSVARRSKTNTTGKE